MREPKSRHKNISAILRDKRRGKHGVSFYVILWLILSVLSISLIITVSVALYMSVSRTYKEEVRKELEEQRRYIHMDVISDTPPSFQNNHSEYLRYLAFRYDANIFVLDLGGFVVFPHIPDFIAGESLEPDDYSAQLEELKKQLKENGQDGYVIYESENAYVYGEQITLFASGENAHYIYVEKSLEFIQNAFQKIVARMVGVAVILSILALAISSALAAWMVKPIVNMTEKARLFAAGDFNVRFRGTAYSRELSELAWTLDYARDELSKTDEMQKQLIANVSHDFKTPLTMVKAYASMIMEISGEVKEKRDKHAQVIIDEADRLASLVTDVLDLSKLRSGIQELNVDTLNMSVYLREIIERFAYFQDEQGYVLETDIDDNLFADVDELKIGQVLYNLIGNAVNYTGEDKTVYVALKKLDESSFRFSVRDTGKGIEKEELEAIWDRYYRSSETHKRPVRGTGLGLSIVKAVLVRHDLEFGVESEVGKGSMFFVDFPISKQEN